MLFFEHLLLRKPLDCLVRRALRQLCPHLCACPFEVKLVYAGLALRQEGREVFAAGLSEIVQQPHFTACLVLVVHALLQKRHGILPKRLGNRLHGLLRQRKRAAVEDHVYHLRRRAGRLRRRFFGRFSALVLFRFVRRRRFSGLVFPAVLRSTLFAAVCAAKLLVFQLVAHQRGEEGVSVLPVRARSRAIVRAVCKILQTDLVSYFVSGQNAGFPFHRLHILSLSHRRAGFPRRMILFTASQPPQSARPAGSAAPQAFWPSRAACARACPGCGYTRPGYPPDSPPYRRTCRAVTDCPRSQSA